MVMTPPCPSCPALALMLLPSSKTIKSSLLKVMFPPSPVSLELVRISLLFLRITLLDCIFILPSSPVSVSELMSPSSFNRRESVTILMLPALP